ncbi:MAG: hypothetical protein JWQ32_572 [Marmoricola sp.]|nr:hypothetical protein [Marmoricola sp.]
MTPIDQSSDIPTLVREVARCLPGELAEQVLSRPGDSLDTLGEAYIELVALDVDAPPKLVAAVEAVLGASDVTEPGSAATPAVVTY